MLAGLAARLPVAPTALQLRFQQVSAFLLGGAGVDLSRELRDGVDVLFAGQPSAAFRPNHPSARAFPEFVDARIAEYVSLGVLAGPFQHRPFPRARMVVSPLGSVPKDGGADRRLIVDMTASGVNPRVHAPSFSFERIDRMLSSLTPDSYVFKVDIARAYTRMAVRPEDYSLLCVFWRGFYYFFTSLPFGLASSPYWFVRLSDAVRDAFVARWSGLLSFSLGSYIDDFFGWGDRKADLEAAFERLCATLTAMGLDPADKPGKLVAPAKRAVVLGFDVDVANDAVSLPAEKRARYAALLSELRASRPSERELQKLIGCLGWAATIQPSCRAFLRPFVDLAHTPSAFAQGRLSTQLGAALPSECAFFAALLERGAGWRRLFRPVGLAVGAPVIATDAAWEAAGGGAACSNGWALRKDLASLRVSGELRHIADMELYMLLHAAIEWAPYLAGCHVRLFTDSKVALGWLRRWRVPGSALLNGLLQRLSLLVAEHAITLWCCHLPGARNRLADALSRRRETSADMWLELCSLAAEPRLAGEAALAL